MLLYLLFFICAFIQSAHSMEPGIPQATSAEHSKIDVMLEEIDLLCMQAEKEFSRITRKPTTRAMVKKRLAVKEKFLVIAKKQSDVIALLNILTEKTCDSCKTKEIAGHTTVPKE